jgi:FkbM family methyltransferase
MITGLADFKNTFGVVFGFAGKANTQTLSNYIGGHHNHTKHMLSTSDLIYIHFSTKILPPLFRLGFPRRWAAFKSLIDDPKFSRIWAEVPAMWTRGKDHQYWMLCDVKIWSGRIAYFYGYWYERDTAALISFLLKEGDTFIDIGANVGMATLVGARAVGAKGKVIAFEPNPEPYKLLSASCARNGLSQVELVNAAITEQSGTMQMFVPLENHGEGSFGSQAKAKAGHTIKVRTVDGAFLDILENVKLIKIDVEGYEVQVLQSICGILQKNDSIFITEVAPQLLRSSGQSAQALMRWMEAYGYTPFRYSRKSGRYQVFLTPYSPEAFSDQCNVLWARQTHLNQLKSFMLTNID